VLVCCAKFNGLVQCITARSTAYFTASLPTEFLVGTATKTLLNRADAASMIGALQSKTRKQLIEQLEEELGELQATMKKDSEELKRTHNHRCDELARSLRTTGLTCPGCGQHSKDIRFIDKSPDTKSYFICKACGRSFRPEDL